MENNNVTPTKNKKDKTFIIVISILSVILLVLFIFFLSERSKNRKHIAAIHQEKELLEVELTDLSNSYSNLRSENDTLNDKLLQEQEKISNLLGEMKKFRDNSYAEINRYKKEINTLKSVLRDYVVQIDSLNQLNQQLVAENTEVKKQSDWLRERNKRLESEQKDMQKVLEIASALAVENFNVVPINKNGREVSWKRCYQLRADFVIPRNLTAQRGTRTIYLRLKRPDGKVIAFSENSFFKYQNVSLTYSAKRDIEYEGERLETSIYWPNDGTLGKGKYVAELFSENENIGMTEFVL